MLSLLRIRLHQAIDLWSVFEANTEPNQAANIWREQATVGLTAQAIPIKRIDKGTIVYVCAIAHQLATQPHHAATIATQLVDTLQRDRLNHKELQGVTVHATPAGFIHFEVGDCAIAAWLDLLLANALPQQPLPDSVSSSSESERQLMLHSLMLFEVQHAHARCCSLLQLAHREALIRLENLGEAPVCWRFSSPASLPWLLSADQLHLAQYADRSLLSQLFDGYDHLSDSSLRQTQASLLRSAHVVAQAFQRFHREQPLLGQREEPTLTITRLGLLMATQRILYLLLWNGLNLYPTIEL